MCTVQCVYLSQRGEQPLGVVQAAPAVGQQVTHVDEPLPDWGQQQLDVPQAGPVQVGPHLQLAQHLEALAVDVLGAQHYVISITRNRSPVIRRSGSRRGGCRVL